MLGKRVGDYNLIVSSGISDNTAAQSRLNKLALPGPALIMLIPYILQ